jgi:hypothetical protein
MDPLLQAPFEEGGHCKILGQKDIGEIRERCFGGFFSLTFP